LIDEYLKNTREKKLSDSVRCDICSAVSFAAVGLYVYQTYMKFSDLKDSNWKISTSHRSISFAWCL